MRSIARTADVSINTVSKLLADAWNAYAASHDEAERVQSHTHMVALYTVWYNFVEIHKKLKMTPAMAAGVSDRLWSVEDTANLVEAAAPKPGGRGPYKKRTI